MSNQLWRVEKINTTNIGHLKTLLLKEATLKIACWLRDGVNPKEERLDEKFIQGLVSSRVQSESDSDVTGLWLVNGVEDLEGGACQGNGHLKTAAQGMWCVVSTCRGNILVPFERL